MKYTVSEIATAIENFAPKILQESYDNAGLQIGNPDMEVSAVLLCLDVTEEILREAKERHCNMIVSHHPLLFKGLKEITGRTPTERIVIDAITSNIAIYAAHTNLDAAFEGVSFELAHILGISDLKILSPYPGNESAGMGVTGEIQPTPKIEFLRKVKNVLKVKMLRYSAHSPQLVVRKVAVCSGSGASLIRQAILERADAIVTGDIKYHDFTAYGRDILIADVGHFESEIITKELFSRIIRETLPDVVTYNSGREENPVKFL